MKRARGFWGVLTKKKNRSKINSIDMLGFARVLFYKKDCLYYLDKYKTARFYALRIDPIAYVFADRGNL